MAGEYGAEDQRHAVCETQWQKKEVELSEATEITDKLIDEGWFDIARAGKWPGSKGGETAQIEVTQDDLAQMAADYSPEVQEAPITFDHSNWGPAHGWISELRVLGEKLQARLKQVSEEMRKGLKAGAWRSRSIEMYKPHPSTGRAYLGALTFLGARAPAAKGLSPLPALFTEGKPNSLAWLEPAETVSSDKKEAVQMDDKSLKASFTEWLKETFGGGGEKISLAEDHAKALSQLAEAQGQVKTLGEQLAAAQKRAETAEATLAESAKASELAEFKATIEAAKAESRLTPAQATIYLSLGERSDGPGRKVIVAEVAAAKDNGLLSEHAKKGGETKPAGRMARDRAALERLIAEKGGQETEEDKQVREAYNLMDSSDKLTFSEALQAVRSAA